MRKLVFRGPKCVFICCVELKVAVLCRLFHTYPLRTVRPVFRYFTPLGPRNFCPPYLFVFSYVQLSFQVQLISSTIPAVPLGKLSSSCFGTSEHTNHIKFLSRGLPFFFAYHTSISIFVICRPWKFAALGPCVNTGLVTVNFVSYLQPVHTTVTYLL
jgi:hypothetical protein